MYCRCCSVLTPRYPGVLNNVDIVAYRPAVPEQRYLLFDYVTDSRLLHYIVVVDTVACPLPERLPLRC